MSVQRDIYINGRFVPSAKGAMLDVVDPATELARLSHGTIHC